MISDKKLNPIVIKIFIRRGRKLNMSLVYIMQSYFKVSKEILL